MAKQSLKQIIKLEYQKCAGDPIYFMKKYCMIQHPVRGKIPFHLYQFQERTLDQFAEHRYNIILKSRQTGISTLTAGFSLWKMLFNQDFNVLVIATKQEVAKNLVTKVRVMNQYLPSWLKQTTVEDNKLSLRYSNGSQIKATSAAGDAGRSEALSLLVFDEAAFIDKIEDIWVSAQSTLSTGGNAIILSTPNGVGNFFHKTWVGAEEETNTFNTIRLHWSVHPERDQTWRDEQEVLLGPKGAAQECDCDFVSSGDTVIDPQLLMFYKESYIQEPVEKTGFDGNLWKWEYPNYQKSYMVVADVARGDSADFSACHVIDIEESAQVAEYKGKLDTKDFGNFLVSLSTDYNNALLVIENANIGWAVIQQVIDRGYGNLFYMSKDLKYVDVENQLNNKYNREERSMTAGFSTTSKTRPLIISKLEQYIREKDITIRSQRTIDELFTFIWNGNRAEAMRGYNDDLTMSLAISLWVRDTALRLRQEGIDLTKQALGGIGAHSLDVGGMGFGGNSSLEENPWNMRVGDSNEDLTWLIK
jgi:hypothetical protein